MSKKQSNEPIVLSFSHRERQLILKFGYPWEHLKEQLDEFKNQNRNRLVEFSRMDLDMVSGNLSWAINKGKAEGYDQKLDEIACMLEREM